MNNWKARRWLPACGSSSNGPRGEKAEAFMADDAYGPHLRARTGGSVSHHFLIEGKDDLA